MTNYLTHLPEKYTVKTIGEEVYPMGSYVNVLFVVFIFLVTDYLRYKPIMILSGISSIICYSLLLGSPSLIALKAGQVFQMFFKAADVAYLTYMFASIKDKNQYQIATSRFRTSIMIGKFSCGVIAEVLKSCNVVSYSILLYTSIFAMVLSTIWAFIMPPVKLSLYFYKEKPVVHEIVIGNREIVRTKTLDSINVDLRMANIKKSYIKMKWSEVIRTLWTDFKVAYEDPNVFKWSAWWSLSLCGYVLVSQYIQLQWEEIILNDTEATLRNGAVESLATLFSAVAAYAIGSIEKDWDKDGELIMAVVSIGLGIMISALAYTESLMISYICYIIFYSTYQTMLTISSVEVAKFLKRDCYSLVFGFNKCITNVLITVLTVVVVNDTFFSFNIQQKFFIYGLYFVFLGCLFLVMSFASFRMKK